MSGPTEEGAGTPGMARQRFPGQPDKAMRDAFAKEVVERARWYTSREGRRIMTEKNYNPVSVASAMVQDVLCLAEESGMSPVQVLANALMNHSATHGFEVPEIEEVRKSVVAVLDRADARAALGPQTGSKTGW